MRKTYIKPCLETTRIHPEALLSMSFGDGSNKGNASLSDLDVSDDTDDWSGPW